MTKIMSVLVAFVATLFTFGSRLAPGQVPFRSSGAAVLLAREPGGQFGGSIPDGTGGLLFADFENNRINRVDLETGDLEVFDANSGGANGLRFDAEGGLVVMEGLAQRVTRRKDGQTEVLADTFDGKSFNAPNDLVFDSFGGIYFTDPNFFAQVQTEGVYYLSPERELNRIISNLHFPNGIGLSPDEKTLYVSTPTLDVQNDIGSVWAYDVVSPGVVENQTLFASGFVDGLDVDAFGNVFGSSWSSVRAWDPNGNLIWSMPGNGIWHVTIHDSSAGYPNTLYLSTAFGQLFKVELIPLMRPALLAGDSDQDLDFDQIDLVQVQIAAKYLTGQAATWREGDWNGAPGGSVGSPPDGDGLFNQFDVIAAQQAGIYLTGPYAAVRSGGQESDGQTSVVYDPGTGEIAVDAPAGTELTSINIDSASGIFTGSAAANLGGSFDNDADNNIFKATFGSSFGSLSFGNVAQSGLSEAFMANDLTVVGSLAGGGDLGPVDLVYLPEPSTIALLVVGIVGALRRSRRREISKNNCRIRLDQARRNWKSGSYASNAEDRNNPLSHAHSW